AADDGSVRPDGAEPAQSKLTGNQRALVDLELGDSPAEAEPGVDALAHELLVIVVLPLQVVLTDEKPFTPDWLVRHVSVPGSRAKVASLDRSLRRQLGESR